MESLPLSRTPLIRKPLFWIAVLSLLNLLLLVWYYPGEVATGDAAYKYLQTRDFLKTGLSQFSCIYPSASFDPAMRFIPFREPFLYIIGDSCFYVFPFQLSIVYMPFLALFGIPGIYLLSLLSTIGILLVLLQLGRMMDLKEGQISLSLVLTWVAGALAWYSLGMNEYAFTTLLSTFAVVFLLHDRKWAWLAAGATASLAVYFRAETASLAAILPGALFVAGVPRKLSRSLHFLAVFSLLFLLFLASNYAVFGHPLGLRSIVFMDHQESDISLRFLRILNYWFLNRTSLLRQTPVLFLLGFVLWKAQQFRRPSCILYLFLTSLGYFLIIPFFVPNDPGPQYGERFISTLFPVAAFGALLTLHTHNIPFRIQKITAWVLVLYTLVALTGWVKFQRKVEHEFFANQQNMLRKSRESDVVILRQVWLANLLFTDYHNRHYVMADTDEKFMDLIGILKQRDVERITVIHSRPPFRGAKYGMPDELVPPSFRYESESGDLGTKRYEMRNYVLSSP